MLFSATLDGAIKVLTRDYQTNAVRHDAGAPEPDGRGAHHVFWRVDGPQRAGVTAELVPAAGPTIVFCRTRRGADRLTQQLEKAGVRGRHPRRTFAEPARQGARHVQDRPGRGARRHRRRRTRHPRRWRGVRVALRHPEDGKAYLHRSGRTARAGAAGLVVSFVGHGDTRTVSRMQRDLEIPAPMTPPDIAAIAAPQTAEGAGGPEQAVGGRGTESEEAAPARGSTPAGVNVRARHNGDRSGGQVVRPRRAVVGRTGVDPRAAEPAR